MKNSAFSGVSHKLETAKKFAQAVVFSTAMASSMEATAANTASCLDRTHPASHNEKIQFPKIAQSIDLVGRPAVCKFMIENGIAKWDEEAFTNAVLTIQRNYNIAEDGILGNQTLSIINNTNTQNWNNIIQHLTQAQITETTNSFYSFNSDIQRNLLELAYRDGENYVRFARDPIIILATMVRDIKWKNQNNEIDQKTLEALMIALN